MKKIIAIVLLFTTSLLADCTNCLIPHQEHHPHGVYEWVEKHCLAIKSDDCFYKFGQKKGLCMRCECARSCHTDKRNLHEYDAKGNKLKKQNLGTVDIGTILPNGGFGG